MIVQGLCQISLVPVKEPKQCGTPLQDHSFIFSTTKKREIVRFKKKNTSRATQIFIIIIKCIHPPMLLLEKEESNCYHCICDLSSHFITFLITQNVFFIFILFITISVSKSERVKSLTPLCLHPSGTVYSNSSCTNGEVNTASVTLKTAVLAEK